MFVKLKDKMRNVKPQRLKSKGFSLDFEFVSSLNTTPFSTVSHSKTSRSFSFPIDIKISYHHECILVNDGDQQLIHVFDLNTKNFKASIPSPVDSLWYMCVEENFDGPHTRRDALIVASDNGVAKYELGKLLNEKRQDDGMNDFMWKFQDCKTYGCLTVLYSHSLNEPNHVYVCDQRQHSILVLNAKTGLFHQRIELSEKNLKLSGIDFSPHGDMILSETHPSHRIHMLRKNDKGQWHTIKTFGKRGHNFGEFHFPYCVLVDKVSQHLIVCNSSNCRICVFTFEGELVKSFGSSGQSNKQFCDPNSMCLNEESGELYVCDSGNKRVQIFQ
ncbi:hypothetical protein C9374_003707 [Naegleria lovaniensis]|uniref:Uncharacterized protein n=1 Tax=Naegleria lovaniensis TaxID=51637 RepID=A0AA88H3P0_NAELO|nr:uncharacterized protein C9374_003707 [Naegleria lovaniensis]KAG2393943.1 hypothetical protein C9374_003707 [Naegleria lovaniensis]